jgi:hypothetical protein
LSGSDEEISVALDRLEDLGMAKQANEIRFRLAWLAELVKAEVADRERSIRPLRRDPLEDAYRQAEAALAPFQQLQLRMLQRSTPNAILVTSEQSDPRQVLKLKVMEDFGITEKMLRLDLQHSVTG